MVHWMDTLQAQCETAVKLDGGDLERCLDELMQGRLRRLVLTRNRCTLATAVWARGDEHVPREHRRVDLRLQAVFASAPPTVLAAVAGFALGRGPRRRHLELMREHFAAALHQGGAEALGLVSPRRRTRLQSRGEVYDLSGIRDDLNQRFEQPVPVEITWGRASPGRRGSRRCQRSVELGSYVAEESLIRIHPVLDQLVVPPYVVEAVVFHEMLHAVIPPEQSGTRRRHHPRHFRERESSYPHLQRAELWLYQNLFRLPGKTGRAKRRGE